MLRAGQEGEFALFPSVIDCRRFPAGAMRADTRTLVSNHAHQAFLAFLFVRSSARASWTAASMMAWSLSGPASVFRDLISCTVRLKMRQRTAFSMNFERSPFFMPWAPRYVRRVRLISLGTLMFQRRRLALFQRTLCCSTRPAQTHPSLVAVWGRS